MYIGASGLNAHGDAISVLGDNIANADTIAFKGSRANFEDILARSVGGGASAEIGLGSRLAQVQRILTQGSLLGTGVNTDLAISGNGYFMVKGSAEGLDGTFYTRAGQFTLDKDGKLVNGSGLVAQGYTVDANGNLIKKLTDIQVSSSQMPAVTTTSADVYANLDANSTTPTTAWPAGALPAGFNPTDASNFQTSLTVYDSIGQSHTINVCFRKEAAAGAWRWHALVDAGETGGTAGNWLEGANGTLTFDTQGRLTGQTTAASSFSFTNAAPNQVIDFNFGDVYTPGGTGTGLKGSTSFASSSAVTFVNQDGYSSGSLSGISIDSDGIVSGVFSNGQKRTVGQILLANFQNPEGMQRIGGNLYIGSQSSGPALVAEAANGGMGTINAGSLEQSNVDLAKQFVEMISFQRGYQANSRTITTADQMLQEALNIKR
jgi:flagellar hook protein FlgE